MKSNERIIFFDGFCNLCNDAVNFVMKHDKKRTFRYVSIQSEEGKKIKNAKSIVYFEKGNFYFKSTAVLKIAQELGGVYRLLYFIIIIPEFIRDFIYEIIARNRYKWFKDSCVL